MPLLGTICSSENTPRPSANRQKSANLSMVLSLSAPGDFGPSHAKTGHGKGHPVARSIRWPVSRRKVPKCQDQLALRAVCADFSPADRRTQAPSKLREKLETAQRRRSFSGGLADCCLDPAQREREMEPRRDRTLARAYRQGRGPLDLQQAARTSAEQEVVR